MTMPVVTLLWITLLIGSAALAAEPQRRAAKPVDSLLGRYYLGQNFEQLVMTRQDATVDFDWGEAPISRHLTLRDHFSARWQGYIQAPESQTYTIHLRADAGVRLWIGSREVIDTWGGSDVEWHRGKITLPANKWVPLRLDYREDDGEAFVQLYWSSDDMSRSLITSEHLSAVKRTQ